MKAIEAILCWTPNRDIHLSSPLCGQVVVTSDVMEALNAHPMSVGAVYVPWSETDDAGRHRMMQSWVTTMVHEDNIRIEVVRAAVTQIDEFRDFPFSVVPKPAGS